MAAGLGIDAVEARIRALYGGPFEARPRVLHVAAVCEDADGRWWSWRLGRGAPHHEDDAWALGLARARADAIVTTGRILRDEPELEHRYSAVPEIAAALAAWRCELLGKRQPPRSVVLTRSGALPPAHPLWRGALRPLIATGASGSATVVEAGIPAGLRRLPEPGLGPLLASLLERDGLETVLVEAGPATTRGALYGEGPPEAGASGGLVARVDELQLTRVQQLELPPAVRGGLFATPAAVARRLPIRLAGPPRRRGAQRWSFERWLRRA